MTGPTWIESMPALPPFRGLGAAFLLLLATLLLLNLGRLLRAGRRPLGPTGLLPLVLDGTDLATRALALLLGLGALAALIPGPLAAGFGWVVVAGAVALGWSAHPPISDLIGWLVILAEGRLLPGRWLELDGEAGQIVALSPRALWLRRADGTEVAWPHRRLLAGRLRLRVGPWAEVELTLTAAGATGAQVQRALSQALLSSPGVLALAQAPVRAADAEGRWRVLVHVVPGQEALAQAHLPDRFDRSLAALKAAGADRPSAPAAGPA